MNRSVQNKNVAIARWQNIYARETLRIHENTAKNPELKARLIGYLMGDGSVTVRKEANGTIHYQMGFYPDDPEMRKSFLRAFTKIYDRKPRVRRLQGHYSVRIESKPIVCDLLSYGSFRSLEWKISRQITESTSSTVEFLRAIFDSEAYVGKKGIVLQMVNKEGIAKIQELLGMFNIKSTIYTYHRKQINWNTNYILCIGRKTDRASFLKHIGFCHGRKRRKLTCRRRLTWYASKNAQEIAAVSKTAFRKELQVQILPSAFYFFTL